MASYLHQRPETVRTNPQIISMASLKYKEKIKVGTDLTAHNIVERGPEYS